MSDRTQHVIDAIDGALDDWDVSGDAMRWRPEPEPEPTRLTWQPTLVPPEITIDWRPASPPRNHVHTHVSFHATAGAAVAHGEALRRAAEMMSMHFPREAARWAIAALAEADTGPPPQDDSETETPRTCALRLRRERGTGPDRQVQHQRRPRRHP